MTAKRWSRVSRSAAVALIAGACAGARTMPLEHASGETDDEYFSDATAALASPGNFAGTTDHLVDGHFEGRFANVRDCGGYAPWTASIGEALAKKSFRSDPASKWAPRYEFRNCHSFGRETSCAQSRATLLDSGIAPAFIDAQDCTITDAARFCLHIVPTQSKCRFSTEVQIARWVSRQDQVTDVLGLARELLVAEVKAVISADMGLVLQRPQ